MSVLPHINRTFQRIGDRYNDIIDKNHFMGRNAFQENWMAPDKKMAFANLKSNDKEYVLEVAFPGYRKEDISIELEKDMLLIRADKKHKENVKESEFLRQEFCHDSMFRSFRVRPNIDVENIKAAFEHGLLTITLPQKHPSSVKQIEIK